MTTNVRRSSKARRPSLTATALWLWARAYAKRHEDAGRGTQYPTLREATRRFRCTLDDIENTVGDDVEVEGHEDYYLGIAVAVGISGSGYADLEPRGEQLVEAY